MPGGGGTAAPCGAPGAPGGGAPVVPSAACMGWGMGRAAPRMMAVTSAAHMSHACCRHCGSCKAQHGAGRRETLGDLPPPSWQQVQLMQAAHGRQAGAS